MKLHRLTAVGKIAPAVLLGAMIGLFSQAALATHDATFELDTAGGNGGNIINNGGGTVVDWSDLFSVNGTDVPVPKTGLALPSGYGVASFIRDFVPGQKGPDVTAYTGGSADVNDISTWSCTRKNNIGNKFNIVNAYATAYVNDEDETILYFALERRGNEGTAAAGFWFLKDGSVGCAHPSGGGSTDFSGNHQDGDLLAIADFTGGGTVSSVRVYQWKGGADGFLDPVPAIAPADADCATAGVGDDACATVNQVLIDGSGPGTDIPWLTETQQPGNTPSNDLDERLFIEGGINLTANGLDACFATFHATTRSSDSLTAEKHDYATGSFPLCKVEVSKTCSNEGGYNQATGKIEIPYSITVKNTGTSIVDNIVATDNECGLGSKEFNFGPIGAGEMSTQGGTCSIDPGTDLSEGIDNGVSATAGDGVSVVLGSSCITKESAPGVCFASCGVNADPALAATKSCVTALLAEDGVVKVKVNFSGTVSNTSDAPQCQMDDTCVSPAGQECTADSDCSAAPVPLINVGALDNHAGALTLLDAPDGEALPTPVTLQPGTTAYFKGSYLPDGTGDGFNTCPSSASFDDTVTASAEDGVFGDSIEETAPADCQLCPEGGCPTD